MIDSVDKRYDLKPPEPKIVDSDYVQGFDNMSSTDFMKIYLETLRYQDPFNTQDISKSLEDMVKLNQVKFFNDTRGFMENFQIWMNQLTFMQTVNLIGKNFVFATDRLDTLKGGEYNILAGEDLGKVSVRIYDGEELVKEIEMDLKMGLNKIDTSDLPKGQYTIKIYKEGSEVEGWQLGFKDKVVSAGILGGEIMLDLESGRTVSTADILYIGG